MQEESERDDTVENFDIIEDGNRLKYNLRIPFPNEHYATSAMNALGVDAPF
jgi:hypothetical protein